VRPRTRRREINWTDAARYGPTLAPVWTVRDAKDVDCYEVSIVRWVDRANDVLTTLYVAVGVSLDFLTWGVIGWGPVDTEPRWLVRARDQRTGEVRTVRTTFTGVGARVAARSVRRALRDSHPAAFAALPDIAVWNGPDSE